MRMRNRLLAISSLVVALGGANLLWSTPAAATIRAYCSDEQERDIIEGFYESCPYGGWGEAWCTDDGFWYAEYHCEGPPPSR